MWQSLRRLVSRSYGYLLIKTHLRSVKDRLAEVCHLGYDISNDSVDAASHEVKASLMYIHDDPVTVERARFGAKLT